MANYLSFQTIYETVMKAIADAQYARSDEVNFVVNMVYNEILNCDDLYPLYWLLVCDDSKTAKPPVTYTAITKANPPVVSATAHGLASGDLVTFYNETVMTEILYRTFRVVKDSANAFHLHDLDNANVDASAYGAAGTGGKAHHRGVILTAAQKIITANWHGYNKGLEFIGIDQIEEQSSWWDKSTSRPLKVMHQQRYTAAGDQIDYLLWFQASDAAYVLKLWYTRQPDRLSAASDVPMLPPQFHDAIIAGAIVRLGENKVQVEAGAVWPAIFNALIESIKTFNRKWHEEHKPFERGGHFLI
jgi:hypothetical protein